MEPKFLQPLSLSVGIFLLYCGLAAVGAPAQTNVEIELVGPWSYVQDPSDPDRVIVVAPQTGHIMTVFKGDNAFDYSNGEALLSGPHRLDFSTSPCVSHPTSNDYLFPLNGISTSTITGTLSSGSVYSLSLPKPCYYESDLESRFKYNSIHPLTQADAERSFTTWMILHYTVGDPAVPADLDKGTGSPSRIEFDSNSGSNKKAISVILYVNSSVGPDTRCDSHSAVIFDSILEMWKIPHFYRAFPMLKSSTSSNQQLSSYDFTCSQGAVDSSHIFETRASNKKRRKTSLTSSGSRTAMSPGRADCHAAQVNVDGVVN